MLATLLAFPTARLQAQVQVAGTLYVELRASHNSAGSATWTNLASLGHFTRVGGPSLVTNVGSSGFAGVLFGGITNDAYLGPNSVPDIDGGSDRSIEVWAYNPTIVDEETTVSWGHRGTTRRDIGFNFGNNTTWGAATHWNDDVSWGASPPSANTWHHLVYTYSNTVVRIYVDGALVNTKTLAGALNTFTNEPINLGCQIEANGARSKPYGGYLNTVRIHGGVLTSSQIQSNYVFGPAPGITAAPNTPTGLAGTPGYNEAWLQWNVSAGATRYSVKRATASGGPYTGLVTNLITTSFLDTNLLTGTNYFYVVSAANFLGESTNSSPVPVTPGAPSQPFMAGTLYVDLRATNASAGSAAWANQGALGGNFASVGSPGLTNDVAGTRTPGVFFNGSGDAYEGPNSVPDIDGASDRSIEVWTYNPSLVQEETTVSWGHRGTTRRDIAFNFGNNAVWGAATHWADDVSWGANVPSAGEWHHLVYTYADGVVQVYLDGALANSKSLGGNLDTFPGEPINLACQRESALGARSLPYGGYLNAVRIHGGVLNPAQVQGNYYSGPSAPPPIAVNDSITLNPGAMALVPVLANDSVPSIFPASSVVVTTPSHGTAQSKPDGRILYIHDGGPSTSDQFNYVAKNFLGATSGVATVFVTISPALRLPNTTITVPNTPPVLGYQLVDAFPGLVVTQALALRTPIGAAYSNLLFFVERRGYISYINVTDANPTRTVFLDIAGQVSFDNSAEGEMGLESMAFHPGFATNGYFFVTYMATGGNPYRERLTRFTANPGTLAVNTNTQQTLFDTTKREFNHNAGDLHFGNDGYLYVSMGDEGNQYNVRTNAQRLDLGLFSGILRLDVDKKPGSLEPNPPSTGNTVALTIPTDGSGNAFYSIPSNNPFLGVTSLYGVPVDTAHLRGEYYAIGFRHPWRFSIDPATGEVWVGHVGQDLYESVDLIVPGGNYGWPYYEGSHLTIGLYGGPPGHPGLSNPPPGFVLSPALWEYPHTSVAGSDPNFNGLDVIGGVVYHGGGIPQLTNAYVFGDFDVGGNIWALRRSSNNAVTVERLTGEFGIGAYGVDPRTGDILLSNYIQNRIRRLVRTDAVNSPFPAKLSDTGIFADLANLTPNPGIVNYEPIIAFWSDYALKRRWFCIPDMTNTVTYATDGNWSFPTGMKWIKHFDLETTRGNPATKKRIETRVLVKTTNSVFGVSYGWNDAGTEAYLVPDGGTNFPVTVQDGTNILQQQWEIPSRSGCLACHTDVGGHALSFNTRELNQATNMNGFAGNQLTVLSQAGYFSSPVPNVNTLPAFARATDSAYSLEYRVRSYLSENCIQCHQPGGAGEQTWDARPWLTMAQTRLINGLLNNDGGDPLNRLIVAGDTNHSVLLRRIKADGFSRMPPLATHQLDPGAISLLTQWITSELTNRQDFAQWQIAWFGSTNNPLAAPPADPDSDGGNNYYEFLTMTSPLTNAPLWKISLTALPTNLTVNFLRLANRGFQVETSSNLFNWGPWNTPGNQLWFSATTFPDSISGPRSSEASRFFRVRIYEP